MRKGLLVQALITFCSTQPAQLYAQTARVSDQDAADAWVLRCLACGVSWGFVDETLRQYGTGDRRLPSYCVETGLRVSTLYRFTLTY